MNTLILCGFKRCGKSYFGKKLAQISNLPFIDTDFLIEESYFALFSEKLSCSEIYKKKGEKIFRHLEEKAISSLEKRSNAIIALGGGALLSSKNQKIVSTMGPLVYLNIEKEELKKRLLTPPLPAFFQSPDLESDFEKYYQKRLSFYEKRASHTISLTKKTDNEILNALKEILDGQ